MQATSPPMSATVAIQSLRERADLIQPCPSMADRPGCSSIGNALLREYAVHLDPLNTNSNAGLNREDELQDSTEALSSASTLHESPLDLPLSSPSKIKFPLRTPKSFLSHRTGTTTPDSAPKQTAAQALISRSPANGYAAASIAATLSNRLSTTTDADRDTREFLSPQLFSGNLTTRTPATAKFASLRSPCLFHQGFDEAINADRVIEEIAAEDDGMSHSRLLQTATSVREISKQLQRRPIKRAVRNVMIITKARDNSLVILTRELAEWLLSTSRYGSDLGVTVYVDAKLKSSKRFDAASLLASNPRYERMLKYWTPDLCYSNPEQFDLVLTLGGDGTVLFTSYLFQRVVPPILCFSLGSLGFLTNFQFASYKKHLNNIMGESGMRVNLRMRFTCTVFRATHNQQVKGELVEGEKFEVLNELVIDRGPSSYISQLILLADDEHLTTIQADGCIFSTPTGSTAYSLSAGGPLTHPSIPGILLTPICPHTLSFRPMVLSDTLMLKVCVPRSSRSTAYASFDGKGRIELRRGDCIQVEAGRYPFPTVVGEGGTGGEWFESVRRALRWNNRGAVQKSFGGITASTARSGDCRESAEILEQKVAVQEYDVEDEAEDDVNDEEWDIDADPIDVGAIDKDSGIGASEVGSSVCASPIRKNSVVAD
ncbi:MAG: NAD(+) kinase [Heterodermia speciosa]|uniref:NAD(+) kinase n=1 Tax=Heterodermia speciosa TaxID=116794 RepID=A0A8H3EEY7_9LECA|nr:MAG: NAD(+) kinase [Heterodermia speciosa]